MSSNKIELKVSGQIFNGWKKASVKRELNTFASSFDLTVSQKYINGAVDIPLDAPCRIFVDGIPVINGYIDEIKPNYSSTSHDVTISGRSKTADLVDCAAIFETGQIMNGQLPEIVRRILAPFNLKLVFNLSGSFLVADFQIQQGETAAAAIERLCAMFSLEYYDDADGNLVISRVLLGLSIGTLIHKIVDGSQNNVLSLSGIYSQRDRFSEYIVKSQTQGSDFMGGEDITSIEGRAVDSEISRYRPLILLADTAMASGTAQERADWEKSTRAGKSLNLNYDVQGWLNGDKDLWSPNSFVTVDDDFAKLKGKLIISGVSLSIDDSGGTISSLAISPPEAFIPSSAKQNIKTFTVWKELKEGV